MNVKTLLVMRRITVQIQTGRTCARHVIKLAKAVPPMGQINVNSVKVDLEKRRVQKTV